VHDAPVAFEALAAELAVAAGVLLRDTYFGRKDLIVDEKAGADGVQYGDVVSEADRAAHDTIAELLAARRPLDLLMSEEGDEVVQATDRHTWIVDPLDGTMNFTLGNPHWCVSVACADPDGRVIAGAVYDACRDELFVAHSGGGARLNGRAIVVRPVATLRAATVVTSMPPGDRGRLFQQHSIGELAAASAGTRSLWAPALDLAWVACGRVHAFAEWSLKLWDVAAARLIVEEAGGCTAAWPDRSGWVAASNPDVLGELLAIVARP
jgi:myo-inositol-1(or 4)-monophosphatase